MQSTNVSPAVIRAVKELDASLDENYHLIVNASWAILARDPLDSDRPLLEQLEWPGLWKTAAGGRCPQHVFEAPLATIDEMAADADENEGTRMPGLQQFVSWAMATATGKPPPGWTAPTIEQVNGWIAPALLTVQCADVASQGRIIRSDNRLAVTFPIVSNTPRTLSASRQEKLEALLREAHNNFRMVRVGFRGATDESRSAVVELDLTGAPHTAVQSLLRYSVDALHHIVRWAGASAALIVDETACELLDR